MIATAGQLAAASALRMRFGRQIRTGDERASLSEQKSDQKHFSDNFSSTSSGNGLKAVFMHGFTTAAMIVAGYAGTGVFVTQSAPKLLPGGHLGSVAMAHVLMSPFSSMLPLVFLFGIATVFKDHIRIMMKLIFVCIGDNLRPGIGRPG